MYIVVFIYAMLFFVSQTGAEEEGIRLIEIMRGRDREIQDIVRSPTKGETEAERKALNQVVGGMFDFGKFSQLSLGKYWKQRSEAERSEFTELCRRLIKKNYADPKLYTKSDRIAYVGAEVNGTEGTVRTVVYYKDEESSIEYKLHPVDGEWLVFDMVIDDLSVSKNNRSQFYKEIRKSSYEGLVKKLKDKLAESDASGDGKG